MPDEQFMVTPSGLRGYADLLRRTSSHFEKMSSYLDQNRGITTELAGLMLLLKLDADKANQSQLDTMNLAARKLQDTISGLSGTADSYEAIDQGTARKMDEKVPRAPDDGRSPKKGEI